MNLEVFLLQLKVETGVQSYLPGDFLPRYGKRTGGHDAVRQFIIYTCRPLELTNLNYLYLKAP